MPNITPLLSLLLCCVLLSFGASPLDAQNRPDRTKRGAQRQTTAKQGIEPARDAMGPAANYAVDTAQYGMLQWRNVGPFRGGRASAVAGVAGERNLFYMGTAGGGVWRTTDGGRSWQPISDGYFGGTVGGLAVAPSDPNVIYAGGGEQTVRGNVSYGYGVWRSVDAGKTWQSLGLEGIRHTGRVIVHPTNADIVYVAAMGDLYKPTQERGVYRSTDGGSNWERILFANEDAGAVDITFDPLNPRVLYASTWRVRRTPYDMSSGGPGSDLWRSTDGGNSWVRLTSDAPNEDDKDTSPPLARTYSAFAKTPQLAAGRVLAKAGTGLPTGTRGIIGVAASAAQRDRVWAIVEADEGGVYRSDDGGDTWTKTNDDRNLRQRAWYYTRIYAHPTDADQVYVMNVAYWHSKDGGKTFDGNMSPHSDHHDLWINPEMPDIMAIADDGGAQVSTDGGENWTDYHNQPTAQFYRVSTDDAVPYRIYAAQQDNSTVRIKHRTDGYSIGMRDWEPTAGCECGHLAPQPGNPDVVYGGCYDGFLERLDHSTGLSRVVSVYPDNPMGHGAEGMKYRFQWNFPIFFSPHDSTVLYTASQHLHKTTDEGQTWSILSPDLTRNDSSRMGPSGGPITKDNTSVEYYCTIFAAGESPRIPGLLWTGSDDGLVHVSRDGGDNWSNVTPSGLPEWTQINSLEVDPHNDGGCYIAGTRYKLGDYEPYLYHTTDYGASWRRIDAGIPRDHFTRVVRVDADSPQLLYAGTESGVYVSLDGAESWQPLQQNLPVVPITDITLKNDDVIVATQGRALWMIDDAALMLRELTIRTAQAILTKGESAPLNQAILYAPAHATLMGGGQGSASGEGTNHRGGATFWYYLPDSLAATDTVRLTIMGSDRVVGGGIGSGDTVRVFSTHADEDAGEGELKAKQGGNTFTWNGRGEDAKEFEGMILWWADMRGARVPPGEYELQLEYPGGTERKSFMLEPDPRAPASAPALAERYAFHREVIGKVSEAHTAIKEMRGLREQVNAYLTRVDTNQAKVQPLVDLGKQMDSTITAVEKALYQTQNRSGQDPLNYPIRLTNKLASLNSMTQGEYKPTAAAYAVQQDIVTRIDAELATYYKLKDSQIEEFNVLVREAQVPALQVGK